jgi:hypothetical protein
MKSILLLLSIVVLIELSFIHSKKQKEAVYERVRPPYRMTTSQIENELRKLPERVKKSIPEMVLNEHIPREEVASKIKQYTTNFLEARYVADSLSQRDYNQMKSFQQNKSLKNNKT